MSTYTGKYSDGRASDATFKRDEEILDNACEGNSARPKLKGWDATKGGFGKASNSAVDPALKYSGANDGYQGDSDD
jgi:hypothetical protein